MGVVVAAVLMAFGLIEHGPMVDRPGPPTPEDARHAYGVARTLEQIAGAPDRSGTLHTSVAELNGLLRILSRSTGETRFAAAVEADRLVLRGSLRLPGLDRLGWVNVIAVVPPFEGSPQLDALRVGRFDLPPEAGLRALVWMLDRRIATGAGADALQLPQRLTIEGERVGLDITLPDRSHRDLTRDAMAGLHGRDMPSRAQVADAIAFLVREADAGRLPRRGSYAPWLQAAIARVGEADGADADEALLAAFLALNYLCGSRHFVHTLLPPAEGRDRAMPAVGAGCGETGLRGRVDLRRHFTTAATLKLISNRRTAITAGEAKELFDMLGDGFDFTDVAANNSGIRLAQRLDGARPQELREIAARIGSEDDVMIDLAGIPRIMNRTAFRMRYGDVDSPAYRAVIAEIEARIDRLPVHAGPAEGG